MVISAFFFSPCLSCKLWFYKNFKLACVRAAAERGWSHPWSLIFLPAFGPTLAFLGHGVSQRRAQTQPAVCLQELLLVPRQGKSKEGRMSGIVSFSSSLHLDIKLLCNNSLWCRCHTTVNVGRDLCTWSSPIYVHTYVCVYIHTHTNIQGHTRLSLCCCGWKHDSYREASGGRKRLRLLGQALEVQQEGCSSSRAPQRRVPNSCGVSFVYVSDSVTMWKQK